MRILLVSSMYPGLADPDFGAFVKRLAEELERQGHRLERAVVDRRAGSVGKQLALARDALAAARRFRAAFGRPYRSTWRDCWWVSTLRFTRWRALSIVFVSQPSSSAICSYESPSM